MNDTLNAHADAPDRPPVHWSPRPIQPIVENHFASVVEASPSALVMVGPDGTIEMVNRQAEHLFDHARQAILGQPIEMLLPERYRGHHGALRDRFRADASVRPMGKGRDLFGLRRDGTEFPLEIGLNPIEINGERMVLAAILDISERRAAEAERERLNRALSHFHAIVESSGDAILSNDLDNIITSWNRGAELLLGYAAGEAIGQNLSILLPTDDASKGATIASGGRIETLRTSFIRQDGATIEVSVTISPIRQADGTVTGVSRIARDVTALEQQRRDLERSNADLLEFAHVASHDLKAPLRAIEHLAQWIREDVEATASVDTLENLSLLRGRTRRLQKLLDGLLTYARVGRVQHPTETVDTKALIDEVVDSLGRPTEFSITCDAAMPVLQTNRLPLRQIFQNLIGNAIAHHDRPTGSVHISAEPDKHGVAFRVTDDGPGIKPQFHQRIFVIFHTLQSRDDVEASGIGLAIVKKSVEERGGTIRVESAPPQRGTSFIFQWRDAPS